MSRFLDWFVGPPPAPRPWLPWHKDPAFWDGCRRGVVLANLVGLPPLIIFLAVRLAT